MDIYRVELVDSGISKKEEKASVSGFCGGKWALICRLITRAGEHLRECYCTCDRTRFLDLQTVWVPSISKKKSLQSRADLRRRRWRRRSNTTRTYELAKANAAEESMDAEEETAEDRQRRKDEADVLPAKMRRRRRRRRSGVDMKEVEAKITIR
ncbi:uncharacterized protein A4U43_C01F10050 [Asparagus officinalis]|uniref:Uncharacterized protein n=1 Tax=Asparagus officinalis TaxID=4686 RepID=A0A5P1FN96_ASPOF|nr:uncharacterized protein A4U43_C01F10050 [Asparagus officinalis]